MRILPSRLGPKLNLSLLAFMLVLGVAIAALMLFGFKRTQTDATSRSREGLEEQARAQLFGLSDQEAGIGQLILARAEYAGAHGASYMVDIKNAGGGVPWDSARLTTDLDSDLIDATPGRITDVWVSSRSAADPQTERDLRESASLDALFPTLMRQSPDAVAIYFIAPNGVTRSYPADGSRERQSSAFDPFSVPGFESFAPGAPVPENHPVWTVPHEGAAGQGLLVTSITPVFDGSQYRGIVAMDLSLARLIANADTIKVTPNGYAFVVGRDGAVLPGEASSRVESELRGDANPALRQTVDAMRAGEHGVARVQIAGKDVFVGYSSLGAFGGSLAVVAPIDEVTEQSAAVNSAINSEANRTLAITLATMIAIFAAALAAAAYLNRRALLRPIESLVGGTRAVAAGDVSTRIPVTTTDELGMLADSFNRMTLQIAQRNEALRQEVAERERTAHALSEREQQYRGVFESTSDALIVTDFEGTIVEANRAAYEMLRYTREQFIGQSAAIYIHPDSGDLPADFIERIRAGKEYHARIRVTRSDATSLPVEVLGVGFLFGGEMHILSVIHDITEQVEAERVLEQRVEDRTREIIGLLEVSRAVASTLDLKQLVRVILDELKDVVDYSGSSLLTLEGDALVILDSRGPVADTEDDAVGMRFPLTLQPDLTNPIMRGETVIVDDVRGDSPHGRRYRHALGDALEAPAFNYVRSWAAVPLMLQDRVVGMLTMSKDVPGYFTQQHAGLALAVATQAATAIENARLFEQAEARTRELSTLLDVSRNVASTLALQPLLRLILEQVNDVAQFDRSALMLLDGDVLIIEAVLNTNDPNDPEITAQVGMRFAPDQLALWDDRIGAGDAVIIEDVHGDSVEAVEYRRIVSAQIETTFEEISTWLGVPIFLKDRVIGMLALSRETPQPFTRREADLVMAIASQAGVAVENARLFEQTEAQTRELSALLDVSHSVASTLDLKPLIGVILDQLQRVVDYTGAAVLTFEDGTLTIVDAREVAGREEEIGLSFPAERATIIWEQIQRLQPVVIDDVHAGDLLAVAYREAIEGWRDMTAFNTVRSWIAVPLAVRDRVIGMMTASRTEPRYFTEQHVRLARAVADQAAVAIENARLFTETERRARETEALLRADAELFRSLSLDVVFQALVDVTVDVLGADKGIVTMRDPDSDAIMVRAARNVNEEFLRVSRERLARMTSADSPRRLEIHENHPVHASPEGPAHVGEEPEVISSVDVPVRIAGHIAGSFSVGYTEAHVFSAEEQRVLLALAERASLAITNAELYERAQQVASLEERQRLARELHDSVSQALYGIALGARTARTLLDRDPAKAVEPVEYVLSLAEAGLTEMRALIFELRPESLESEGLVAALDKQVAVTRARYGIDVQAALGEELDVPIETKEAIYRIAQESLHNTVKHARATQVQMRLERVNGLVQLELRDNGIGFDPSGAFPGHLGLRSMRERVERLGGTFEIESAAGKGTRIRAAIRIAETAAAET